MPALDWITIEGFRSIRRIERLKLDRINIIIGANGSGKSNFIGAFSFLNAVREGRLQEYVGRAGGADNVLFFGSRTTQDLHFHLSFEEEVNQYGLHLTTTADGSLVPVSESVYYWNKQYPQPYNRGIMRYGLEAGISRATNDNITSYVQHHLDRWRLYHFHDTSSSSPFKQACDVQDNRFLRSDGSNLAAFLYTLQTKYPASYNLIVSTVRQVAPFFAGFVLSPTVLNEEKIRLEWKHAGTDAYFGPSSLSDGTIRFIALATLFLQPIELRPSIILVDEPELGLHPFAITMLANLIRQTSIVTQVIVSTQSALLLDHFDPQEVLVADRINEGTEIRRLVTSDLDSWLEEYSLGQLWEKAELGGRPS